MKSSGAKSKILVLCCGNPLRSDDGAGLAVAQQLEEALAPDLATVLYRHQLVPELAEPLSQADVALFVDAREDGIGRGDLSVREVAAEPGPPEPHTHDFNPTVLLAYAKSVYGHVPRRCELYTIGGQSFDYGTSMSPAIRERVPELVKILLDRIETESRGRGHA